MGTNNLNRSANIRLTHNELHVLMGLVDSLMSNDIMTDDDITMVDLDRLMLKLEYGHSFVVDD